MSALKNKKEKRSKNKDFLNSLDTFKKHVGGLQKAMEVSMLVATSLHAKENEKIKEFINQKGKNIKDTKGVMTFKLKMIDKSKYQKLINEENKSAVAIKLIPRSIFVSLVSQFDLLIANMMRAVLVKYPKIISKEKTLSFEEALNFSSFDEIRTYFIEEEINNVLRGDHVGQINWFEKNLSIKLKECLTKKWNIFVELTERRNLFVHSDGIVNDYYIDNLKKNKIEFDKNIKKGDVLMVTPDYFKEALQCLYEISIKLSWLVWRKMEENDIEDIDTFFSTEIGVELIDQGEYLLAENLFSFYLDNSEGSSDLVKNIFFLNLVLAKKSSGNMMGAINLLDTKDWSASRIEFKFVNHVLRDEFDDALILMEKIGKTSDILIKENYLLDPIYKKFREIDKFKTIFKKIYGEEYVSSENDLPPKKFKNRKI